MRVELRGVCRVFDDQIAIDGLDLDVQSGELCVLLGPSGCGKSTTLRCVAGLESVDAGEILFDGKIVNDLDPAQRDVAMVFQSYALYPHMSVAANIAFPLRMRRMARAERTRRVADAAHALGLDEFLQRRPRELSGGQQQRVALARAIVREPQVFLFDEPLSNLDARLRLDLRGEIRALHERLGATMLWVTHDQAEAMSLGDRVAVLDRGRLQQVGTPREVFARPANRFVAGFIGSPPMNFVRCGVEAGRCEVLGHPFRVVMPDVRREVRPELAPRGVLEVGIRPHHLRIGHSGPLHARGEVHAVESHGHESFVSLRIDGAELTAWVTGHSELVRGAAADVSFSLAELHAFDEHGQRVQLDD